MKQWEINKLSFSYNTKKIIDEISFSFNSGERIALMGPNGSGKTTLLKILAGINKNYEGNCFFENEELKGISNKSLAKSIAFVPGEFYTPFDFEVKEIVAMGLSPYKKWWQDYNNKDREEVFETLKILNIEKLANKNINQISSGEKQLVLLAQAFIQKTKVILLDEPISHLDLKFKIKIFDFLDKIKGKTTIFLSLHDLKPALNFCDYSLIIKNGKKVFYGESKKVEREIIKKTFEVPENIDLHFFI